LLQAGVRAITLATERVFAETLQLNNIMPCKLQSCQIKLVSKPKQNSQYDRML